MSAVLIFVGLLGFTVGLVGLLMGGVRRVGLAGRKQSAWLAVTAFAVMALGAEMAPSVPSSDSSATKASLRQAPPVVERSPEVFPDPVPSSSPVPEATVDAEVSLGPSESSTPNASSALGPLLVMAGGGDGDSWRDSHGVEYRLGLVNAPEVNECGGSTATAYRKRKLQGGFYARTYTTDRYGRQVAVVYTPAGVNLNVLMAREGIANDRYFAQYRTENATLARQLDAAFAQAKANKSGVWGSCSSSTTASSTSGSKSPPPPAPAQPATSSCHPDYKTCIAIKGDGSGRGEANDLDCGDIRKVVYLRSAGRDPYRLDNDGDGVGCESYR